LDLPSVPDFGDLGPGFEVVRPDPPVVHDYPLLENRLAALVGGSDLVVESKSFHNWAAAKIARAVASEAPGEVAVAVGDDRSMTTLIFAQAGGEAVGRALMSPRVWGKEAAAFKPITAPIPVWAIERRGFSYVVIAVKGPYLMLMEGPRLLIESVLEKQIEALTDLPEG
jgi:hypothetical protein